jgi:hypothetical protein
LTSRWRLQPGEAFDCPYGRERSPFEHQLPLEQRSVQLAPGQDSVGLRHAATLPTSILTASPTRSSFMSWLTILIIVVIVLLVLGFFGRGRFRA